MVGHAVVVQAPQLTTYQPQLIQELLHTTAGQPTQTPAAAPSSVLPPGNTWQARKAAQRAVLEAQAQAKEAAFRAAMQAKHALEVEQREAHFQSLVAEVVEGLQCGSGILAEVQEVLDHAETTHRTRQTALYQQWSSQVFDKFQERLQQSVASTLVQQLEAALSANSDAYISATNSQLVFRDVIVEADYDRLRALSNSIKVPTGDLVDPLKRDLLKTHAEKALLTSTGPGSSSDSGSSRHLAPAVTRSTLEVKRWAAGQINATPYGHCIDDTTSDYVVKSASAADLQQKSSHVYFDDYSLEHMVEAYKPSKHMTPSDAAGNRAKMTDLMQGRCSGTASGDSWLEHKGKKRVDGPEVAMGRRGLAEVIQQSGPNPYLPGGRALDDAWLQPSGKQKVPGPEVRRGRNDLREIIQQSSNPYEDGRSLGDLFLEQRGKRRVDPPGSGGT